MLSPKPLQNLPLYFLCEKSQILDFFLNSLKRPAISPRRPISGQNPTAAADLWYYGTLAAADLWYYGTLAAADLVQNSVALLLLGGYLGVTSKL